ncbi:hypothetical protein C8J57DRAFT_1386366 [Mycena rebaudengoi]|nr:hypothetical protein C8J57DRAFT_1386366 [Mycena rebaudengoi]
MPLNSSTCLRPVLPFLRVSVPASYRSLSSSLYGCRRIGNPMPVLAALFLMLTNIPLYIAHRVLMKDIRQHCEAAPLGARFVPDIPSSSFANLRALIMQMYDRRYGYPSDGFDTWTEELSPVVNINLVDGLDIHDTPEAPPKTRPAFSAAHS